MRTISAAAGHRTQTSRKSWGDKGDRAPIEGPGKAVLGPENCLVAAACEQFCLALLGEDRSAAQPFVLYGPVATGKSSGRSGNARITERRDGSVGERRISATMSLKLT